MRTIKFKAKTLENGQWIYGDLVHHANNDYILPVSERDKIRPCCQNVDPDTVCQFTGFTDKNDKKIYEGDILRADVYPFSRFDDKCNEKDNYYGVMKWFEGNASFGILAIKNPESAVSGISEDNIYSISQPYLAKFEVIGSVHCKEWQEKLPLKDE